LNRFNNPAEYDTEEARNRPARFIGITGGGGIVVGDNAVDSNDDVFDLRNEGMEPSGNGRATAQGFDVTDVVEDQEEERVRQAVEAVVGVGRRREAAWWFRVDLR